MVAAMFISSIITVTHRHNIVLRRATMTKNRDVRSGYSRESWRRPMVGVIVWAINGRRYNGWAACCAL